MRTIETTDLTVCTDCIMIMANGADADDYDQRAHLLRMFDHTADWRGNLAPGDEVADFATSECDTCGTTYAGVRYAATLLTEVLTYDQPAMPTHDEWADAVMDWGVAHPIGHQIQRVGRTRSTLICHTCGASRSTLFAPAEPATKPRETRFYAGQTTTSAFD